MKTKAYSFILFIILIQLVPVCMAEESGPSTWHQFQKDIVHSGFYRSVLPEAYGELWNVSVNAIGDSSPVVAEGKVFVNCNDNHLKALNVSTGDVEWSMPVDPLQYGSWSSPAYDNGMIFTSTGYNTTCFNATDGSVIWSVRTGASCNGGPMIADGKVFCNDWNSKHYYCLNESNGNQLWRFTIESHQGSTGYAQGTAAYKDDRVYLTSWDYGGYKSGHVYCLNATNGSMIWDISFGRGINMCGSATLGNDAVYVTSYNFYGDTKAYALNMTDGSILWETPIKRTDSTPALAYGNIYISSGYNGNYKTYCLNASNGSIVWETSGVGGWTNSVAVADGKVFAGIAVKASYTAGYTTLVELDAYTGDILWKTTGGSTCALSDGNIYTIYKNGNVYAYTSAAPTIDIVMDDLELSTGTAYPYYDNEITATIRNNGNKYVNNVSVLLKVNGTEVDSQVFPVVEGAGSQSVSLTWVPPKPGNYTVTMETYSTDPIIEVETTNNAMSIDVTAISGEPDLVPTEIAPVVYANQSYKMKTTITNMGYMKAASFLVNVKEGTSILANETISSLDPSQSTDVYFNWTSPDSGNIDLTITVDAGDTVKEGNEANNELVQTIAVKHETPVEVLPNTDWPQFQRGSYQNGVTTGYSPQDNFASLKWRADDFNGNIDIPPVVVGDMVYVVSSSGMVYAYDKNNGTPLWNKDTGDSVGLNSATPAYGDGNLFVATHNGNLYAYNSTKGSLQWKVNVTGDSIESPVTYYDHRIYVADGISLKEGTKYYYCYDDLGNLLWKYAIPDTAGFVWNGASVIGNYVVFSTHEGKLISLDRKTGTLADEISLNSSISTEITFAISDPGMFRSSIMYNDGYVYTTSEKGQSTGYVWKIGFDEETGTFSDKGGWRSGQIFSTSTPAIYDGKIYVGQGEHGEVGELICLNDSTGNEIWSYDVTSGVKSSPVISTYYNEPYIYFTSAQDNGSLYCLDGNGTLVWEYNPPDDTGYILQGAAISEGKAYFGTDGGCLYCVEGDWNPWNDPDSESGNIISLNEIRLAVYYWQYSFPTPATGHIISLSEIRLAVYYWQYYFPM